MNQYEIAFIKKLVKYTQKSIHESMPRRVMIVLDDDLAKKLRIIQSKKISKLINHVSFSRVINEQLRKVLK